MDRIYFKYLKMSIIVFLILSSSAFAQPVINSFSPTSGSVGTLVSVKGVSLSNPINFIIGGSEAIVISNDGNTLVGMVMPGAATGIISIITEGGSINTADNFTLLPSEIPSVEQGVKLVGTGIEVTSRQGCSVALSADGTTAIIGGFLDNFDVGAVWIYTRNGGIWSQQGDKLVGTGSSGKARQGFAVSLSADGNTAMVGGYMDNNEKGAVWIFTRSDDVWTQQGDKLVCTDYVGAYASIGYSVSISADGNTGIAGGFWDKSGAGAAWIFTRTDGIWTQQGSKLVGSDYAGTPFQGKSVSISADGNTAIVGGYSDNSGIGAAWIFTRSEDIWTQQGSKLVGTDYVPNSGQGTSVSISADGNTAVVGGIYDNELIGAAWIFTRNESVWTQEGDKLVGSGVEGQPKQGNSVSISADGNTVIVGGDKDNSNTGAAWLFTRSGDTWQQEGNKIVGKENIGASLQGTSVALSADGNTALIGGLGDDNYMGATWAYSKFVEIPTTSNANIEDLKDSQIWLFPNPAKNSITITGLSKVMNGATSTLRISDIIGKTVLLKTIENNANSNTIDISSYEKGQYFIILTTDGEEFVKAFMKK